MEIAKGRRLLERAQRKEDQGKINNQRSVDQENKRSKLWTDRKIPIKNESSEDKMNPEKRVKTCGENPKGNKEIWESRENSIEVRPSPSKKCFLLVFSLESIRL